MRRVSFNFDDDLVRALDEYKRVCKKVRGSLGGDFV